MIRFVRVGWKNFLSTGNDGIEIDIASHRTTLIIGENGSGKSTLLDAITFALFGRPYRKVSKSMLVNSINNSGCVAEVEFESRGDSYKIVRGMKPNVLDVFKNGAVVDVSGAMRDTQSWIEENVLGFDYKSFCQIVILGSANFVPFMQLTAQDRREVIESVLDIGVIGRMNVAAKARLSAAKASLADAERQKKSADDMLAVYRTAYAKALARKSEAEARSAQSARSVDVEIARAKAEIDAAKAELQSTIDSVSGMDVNSMSAELASIDAAIGAAKAEMRIAANQRKFYAENESCASCGKPIGADERSRKIAEAESTISQAQSATDRLGLSRATIAANIKAVSDAQSRAAGLASTIKSGKANIESIRGASVAVTFDPTPYDAEIAEAQSDLQKAQSGLDAAHAATITAMAEARSISDTLSVLKDDGAKSVIVSKYVPIINANVNKFLAEMGFYAAFELDENFDEHIRSRHRDKFKYESFSEGQKLRIDLALLFTWREIAKMKNSTNTNLLIFDEIFDSSLDAAGTDAFLRILASVGGGASTIVISHKTDETIDRFDRVLRAEMRHDFTRYVDG